MKKLFLLLAAVGTIFTACGPVGDDGENINNNGNNDNSTEQPGEGNNEGGGENPGTQIPDNEIWYTTADDNIVELSKIGREGDVYLALSDIEVFGANIISHTYENGKGIIKCDGDIFRIRGAFLDCTTLINITIPNKVTLIGEFAFTNCVNLTNITLPNGVTSIGLAAFGLCTSLTSISIPNSVTTIERCAFERCYSLASVTIGSGVTKINAQAFAGCESLVEVVLPDNVLELGDLVFERCISLTKATIGKGVSSIGVGLFTRCANLEAIYGKYASEDNRCLIVDGVLKAGAVVGTSNYVIPDGVTAIDGQVFQDYSTLMNITLPNSLTSIGDRAFYGCYALKEITIPANVTYIGTSAFVDCCSLKSIYCKPTTPPYVDYYNDGFASYGNIFEHEHYDDCPNNFNHTDTIAGVIYVPAESVGEYKSAYGWSWYRDRIFSYNF